MEFFVKLSQPGYDVKRAGDQDMLFNSSFPLLKEAATDIFDASKVTLGSSLYKVANHDLRYVPFFLVFDSNGEMVLGQTWYVDDQAIYVTDGPAAPTTGQHRWVLYHLPIYEAYEAPVSGVQFATEGGSSPDFAVKFAKKGKSIDSDDLRDFTLHSETRSPLLHIVSPKVWKTGDAVHTVDPDLPYNPICFGFSQDSTGKTYNMQAGGQAAPTLERNRTAIEITSQVAATSQTSIVIFKDPFLARSVEQVAY